MPEEIGNDEIEALLGRPIKDRERKQRKVVDAVDECMAVIVRSGMKAKCIQQGLQATIVIYDGDDSDGLAGKRGEKALETAGDSTDRLKSVR